MSIKALNWAFSTYIETPSAKLTLIALANYASHPRGTPEGQEECWPMQSTLSEITSLNRRTVIRSLKILIDLGLISTRREPATQGRFEQNIYVLHLVPPSVTVSHGPSDTESHGTMCHGVTCPCDKCAISTGHSVTCSINPSEPLGENRPGPTRLALFSPDKAGRDALLTEQLATIWNRAVKALQSCMDPQSFQTWVPPLLLIGHDPFRVWCPNGFFVEWWQQPAKTDCLRSVLGISHDQPLTFVSGEVFSVVSEAKTS